MIREQLEAEGIVKEEAVGFLKSKINLQQGTLFMTPARLVLSAGKTGVGGFGLLGALLKKKVEKKSSVFDLSWDQIAGVAQGKHGRQANVLEVTDKSGATYRMVVKEYGEWGDALSAKLGG